MLSERKPTLVHECEAGALDASLAAVFRALPPDESTWEFVNQAISARGTPVRSGVYDLLRYVMSDYDAYGLLGLFPMHLLSAHQWQVLVGETAGALLDVGAGNGAITRQAAELFDRIVVNEASSVMRKRLVRLGYELEVRDLCLEPNEQPGSFDVVSCFNVLDRCSYPHSLIDNMAGALKPAGRLLVSVPLPARPHVHVGPQTVDQEQLLTAAHGSWEAGAKLLGDSLRSDHGLTVESLSRVPYLCAVGPPRGISALDSALFVCRLGP